MTDNRNGKESTSRGIILQGNLHEIGSIKKKVTDRILAAMEAARLNGITIFEPRSDIFIFRFF